MKFSSQIYNTTHTPVSPCRCSYLCVSLVSNDRCGRTHVVDPQSQERSIAAAGGCANEA